MSRTTAGNYVISVTTDRSGASEKAIGRAVANVQGFPQSGKVSGHERRTDQSSKDVVGFLGRERSFAV